MYCGPNAIATITGWTRDQAWLHIRALREAGSKASRVKRVTAHPFGGTTLPEVMAVAERAGWVVAEVTLKPMTYGDFIGRHGRRGRWLCVQPRHFFSYIHGRTHYHSSQAGYKITRAYRLIRGASDNAASLNGASAR